MNYFGGQPLRYGLVSSSAIAPEVLTCAARPPKPESPDFVTECRKEVRGMSDREVDAWLRRKQAELRASTGVESTPWWVFGCWLMAVTIAVLLILSVFIGVTFRDLRDCFIRGCYDASGLLVEDWPKDIYGLPWDKMDPIAVFQNMACWVERYMGIFPNVPELRERWIRAEMGIDAEDDGGEDE